MTQILTECWALQCDECKRTFFHGRRRPPLRPVPDGWQISKGVPIRDLCPGCNENEGGHAMTAPDPADTVIEPTEFALQIMTKAYGYQECVSFATVQDGKSEPGGWCLTHDQSYRYCREYQDEILTPLVALIEARDAKLADPADRDYWRELVRHAEASESWERNQKERAEAEVAELRQKLSDCELLLTDLGKTHTRVSGERDELRATVERVRALADRWNTEWLESVRPEHRSKVRPAWAARGIWRALDGGEQHD